MRYTRLRRQIESGTLIGTHGTPFQRAAEKGGERGRKRKRDAGGEGRDDDEEEEEVVREKTGGEVKRENTCTSASDEYESDTPYERESDDETALAKRNARLRAATIEPRMPRQLIAPLQRSQEERKKKKEMPDSAGSE